MPPSDDHTGPGAGGGVRALSTTVHQVLQPISDVIPLYLHVVRGTEATAAIDAGLPDSADLLDELIRTGGGGLPLRYLCNTHAHHDHIGNLRRLRARHGALVVAAEDARGWIADPRRNLHEFALHHPHIIGPTSELLAELEPTFDGPAPVDVMVGPTIALDLGGGVELEAFRVDGHLHAELAWFERSSRTLVLGDVVTAIGWPIFHGHVDPGGLRQSLDRLVTFVREREVEVVAMSHHPARGAAAFLELVGQVQADVDRTRQLVLAELEDAGQDLESIWHGVCAAAAKDPEFRALAMVEAHLRELVRDGVARVVGPETYALAGPGTPLMREEDQ